MPIKVEHAGDWDPTQYRNYTEPDRTYKRPKRRYEGLPSLPRVSKPQGLTEVTPKQDASPLVDKSLQDANKKDLKSKNISTSTDK